MRSHLLVFLSIAPSVASADGDSRPATSDDELRRYVAEAEEAGETIEVDGAAPVDTPSSGVRVVTARELELTPHKNTDDLLRVVPGLYMSQHGSEGKGQQFFLRGFDAVHGSDLAIRVAGIPINEMSNVHGQGYADIGFVIPEVVAGLTSRKGPFDLEQGWFGTAGSIDLELGVSRRGPSVSYELGSTNRHRIAIVEAPEKGPDAEFIAADVMHDDGFGVNRGTERGSVMAQTELRAGRLRIRPLVSAYWARFGEPGVIAIDDIRDGFFDRMGAPAGTLGGRSRRMLAGVGANYKHGDDEVLTSAYLGWRGLSLDENFTGFLESEEFGDARSQEHRAVTTGARVAWRHRLSPSLRLLTGVELQNDELHQLEDRISTTGAVWRNERALDATVSSAGLWTGLEAKRGAFTATGGARIDAMMVDANDRLDPMRSGDGMVGTVSPRLAVAWRNERFTMSAAAGRGQRPPEARAFTSRVSRENMDTKVYDGGEAEITSADSVELGGEARGSKFSAGVTGFATRVDRESIFDHVSGVNALQDGSRRFGVEVAVQAMPLPWLALRGDLTAVDARFNVSGNPVPGAPRLLGSIEARIDHKPWSAGIAGRFLGARPLTHGAMAAASSVVDAVGNWTHGRWELSMQIDNLLGTDWNEGEFHFASRWDPAAPRTEIPRVHISPGRPFGVRAGATVRF